MSPERWRQVKALFDRALECSEAERAEFVVLNCGPDDELRSEVEALLAAYKDGDTFAEYPASAVGFMADASLAHHVPSLTETLNAGTLILPDRYEILRELGRGGMSLVYLAQDRQLLSRRVVVKVLLKTNRQDSWVRHKFLQEMEALARINHPGVVGVLDAGLTAGGSQFLVMQYIEGATLRQAIEPRGMNLARAAGIIRQVGQALAAAHEKGVWHRDLKPENIMLESLGGEEHVKLIDFGIAGVQNSHFSGEKSKVAGTLTYMAPEQFVGQPCAASDTYALGVVAYEMLTGMRPGPESELQLTLPTAAATSILKALSYRPELRQAGVRQFSEELYQALTSAETGRSPSAQSGLEIESPMQPASEPVRPSTIRYRTGEFLRRHRTGAFATAWIALVLTALAATAVATGVWRSRSVAPPEHSIAVLPFEDLSAEMNQGFLSQGLAEELQDALSRIGWRVPRVSSTLLKAKAADPQAMGQKLNVAMLVEGSIRRQGSRARINVRLIRTADRLPFWSDTFDREMIDILAVQQEIAQAVTRALGATLAEGTASSPAQPGNAQAYNAYLEARYFVQRGNKENFEKAVSKFQEAIRLSPGFAKAYIGLAQTLAAQADWGLADMGKAYGEARANLERALNLDEHLAEGHAALGHIKLFYAMDWAGADDSYRRAMQIDPNNGDVLFGAAVLARAEGRLNDAVELHKRDIENDPLNPMAYHDYGLTLHYLGRHKEAAAALKKSIELGPEMGNSHALLSRIYLALSQPQEALTEVQAENHPIFKLCGLALAYHALGRKPESDTSLAKLIELGQKEAPFNIADVYAFRGDKETAFNWLERAYISRDAGLLPEIKTDPLLESLRSDARYEALLRRMNLPR
jgi:serine/threonine protein kinase/tetratricopeptide (TPR) repeat protein